jgi:hypothetical protein
LAENSSEADKNTTPAMFGEFDYSRPLLAKKLLAGEGN